MAINIVLAPIKGYTDPLWRSCYFNHFKGVDKVVTPFLLLSEHNNANRDYFPKFLPELGSDISVVPQYLVKNPETIVYSSKLMSEIGVTEFNLNMGCPAPAIYKKGRGSGLLKDLNSVKNILDGVIGNIPGDFTVKIRTGLTDNTLVKPLVDLLNNYKLKEVIVHPRYASQLYSGTPDLESFNYVYKNSLNPVSYNGDITTVDGFKQLYSDFPDVSSWMIGRGVLMDPYLPSKIKGISIPGDDERKVKIMEYIHDFHEILIQNYHKPGIVINRLKSLLIYIGMSINNSEEFVNRIKRASSLDQMLDIIFLN